MGGTHLIYVKKYLVNLQSWVAYNCFAKKWPIQQPLPESV